MSDSNWSVRVALIGCLTLLTFVALGTGAFFGALHAPHYGYQAEHPANRNADTEQTNPSQIDRDRAGLPYFAERITSGPDPEDGSEREKRDLAAQESMSVWAFWLLFISAVGTLTTMIGTGFLLWQIILTREAVKDTEKATTEMARQTAILERANRPLLHIESIAFEQTGRTTRDWSVVVKVKNFGQTPAAECKIQADWKLSLTGRAPTIWRMRDCAIPHEIPQGMSVPFTAQSSDQRVAALRSEDKLHTEDTYVKITMEYEDRAGNKLGKTEIYKRAAGFGERRSADHNEFRFHASA